MNDSEAFLGDGLTSGLGEGAAVACADGEKLEVALADDAAVIV